MLRFTFSLLFLSISLRAAELTYSHDLSKWLEISSPSKSNHVAGALWSYAANYSDHEWRVFQKNEQPQAELDTEPPEAPPEQPSFTPSPKDFPSPYKLLPVADGWLVSFNEGEFGAALHWFSRDGQRNYKISDHKVIDFFTLPTGIHAIEGLAHLSRSRGSVIRIAQSKNSKQWEATALVQLPFAPAAVSIKTDGTMVITLSASLVLIGPDLKIQTLLFDAPWSGLYPNSSILSKDEQKLYIGMRQFVGEFDLAAKKLRLLIPSQEFLNKLPKKKEDQIRKQYSR